MESDTDTQLTISKWPFYLGDILLVGVAITIGALSNWELTDLQVAYCVVAVALGSGLFVLMRERRLELNGGAEQTPLQ